MTCCASGRKPQKEVIMTSLREELLKTFKKYNKGLKAEYQTQFEVMIDPTTGVPCQEREVKVGTHTMVNPDTKDTATFKSQITLERLYTIKKPAENEE